ncbi:mannose-1-phosphate guanylyltransferase/mannose-6-phosphate isomerase [Photobacterium japonica]|uniref:mannose-1-phosphate guanylyltransferase/mannose-6-phosphate isomerase n=1 Tax=Photobacterium japonica TaxID=2910235 RepID=UPI003D0B1F89
MKISPVILAGGNGSRLWPYSRSMFPKQFLSIGESEDSMLQTTLMRLDGLDTSEPVIISNEEHRFIAAEQLRSLNQKASILLEPAGRNTAPAIAIAAMKAMECGEDPILLVLAADHVVQNISAFQKSVLLAQKQAKKGALVTFGIVPTEPETGYGYIHRGALVDEDSFTVEKFVEKPCLEKAQQYLESGEFYWNSGCFMFKASAYLDELKQFAPAIYEACALSIAKSSVDRDFVRVDADEFIKCPDDSIDYAVMERTDKAIVVPMDAGWSDVGSWSALWDISAKDENGNASKGDAILENSQGCLIHAPNKLVAAVGLKDIIVVETKDAVLVANKSNVQEVKKVVEHLKSEQREEYREHREVYRPWGMADAIDKGGRYKVNRITVKPGERQTVQIHYHRAEHWVVVSGTAKVTKGDETFIITENQSTYIPVGIPHSIENPGKMPLELIEIQSGSYLKEDDIIRL